jgi:hypothetical protein
VITRRAFVAGAAAGAGLLLARGLGVPGIFGDAARGGEGPGAQRALLRALAASLTPGQREILVLPADHPSRQITNTLAVIEKPHLGTILSPQQRALVERLYGSMLSPRGRQAFAGTVAVEGRLDGCVLALYGDPEAGNAQAVIMGGHLMLRGGAAGPGGAAFGGGISYGHQIGNERWRVPGNSFAFHGDAANRLYARLSPEERGRAVLARPPHELVLQAQGAAGVFPGARIGSLSEAAQQEAARLVETVFASYPEAERSEALACIEANGGLAALHFACYASHGFYADLQRFGDLDAAERVRRGDPYWQVWRLEGPGTVLHFQGHPHVHAYVQVVRDPARANLGETLGVTAAGVEGEAMVRLLEAALRRAAGEELAFYGDQAPGRFCPGEVTTGLAWSMDPYCNRIVVATVEGRAMGAALRERIAAGGSAVEPRQRYRVASAEYFAQQPEFGEPERVETSEVLLRDAVVAHLRAGGLASLPVG